MEHETIDRPTPCPERGATTHADCDYNAEARPTVKLLGRDGNAFAILGTCAKAARATGWDKARIDAFLGKAADGDYDHLLGVVMEHFEVE